MKEREREKQTEARGNDDTSETKETMCEEVSNGPSAINRGYR